jgi:superfamily II DNA or RNA helicase
MSGLRLRGYQQECLDAIDASLQTYNRVAVVAATGLGKTVIFSHLIERENRKGRRALVLVHREELAEQAKTKLHSVAPHLSVGIVKAERNEVDADVIVASVQTLANWRRREQVTGIGVVIVDECHHAVARTWMEVLADFGCFPPETVDCHICNCSGIVEDFDGDRPCPRCRATRSVPAIGLTATLSRTDGKGLGDVWETVAFERDIVYGIEHGYLTDVRGQAITVDGLDLATVARNRGDYQEGQLGEALENAGAGEVIAKAYLEHASVPEKWKGAEGYGELTVRQGVLFAPTVATAYSFAESLRAYGISAETIEGNTSSEDRKLIYKRYEAGEIKVLSNAMVLTEGWDAPWCEVAVIARPTQSAALYTQMVGRVLRPWPGKDDALVLDVVGAAGRHKLQSLTDLVKTQINEGESYAEARIRVERELQARLGGKAPVIGTVAAQQVELFANSHSSWLQTAKGVWFVPVKGGVFFLYPEGEAGTYTVGYKSERRGPAKRIHTGLDLGYAMAHGESLAEEADPTVSLKDRAWRRTKPSEGQVAMALRLKVAPVDEIMAMRKGAVSDLISIKLASRMLDPR